MGGSLQPGWRLSACVRRSAVLRRLACLALALAAARAHAAGSFDIDMAALSRHASNPAQFLPTDPGFRFALHVLAHESAHQWLTRVRFLDAQGQPSSALLGQQGAHWSYLLDSDASHMYGLTSRSRQRSSSLKVCPSSGEYCGT